jgi:LysM domain-containing protein
MPAAKIRVFALGLTAGLLIAAAVGFAIFRLAPSSAPSVRSSFATSPALSPTSVSRGCEPVPTTPFYGSYLAKSGDTLKTLADRFCVALADLQWKNRLGPDAIFAGDEKLSIPAPKPAGALNLDIYITTRGPFRQGDTIPWCVAVSTYPANLVVRQLEPKRNFWEDRLEGTLSPGNPTSCTRDPTSKDSATGTYTLTVQAIYDNQIIAFKDITFELLPASGN